MSNTTSSLSSRLLKRYSSIMAEKNNSPEWAVHKFKNPTELVMCTIPFVGSHYGKQFPKILVYASAEVLTNYYEASGRWLDGEDAVNRHRKSFEEDDSYFPNVHIAPMNNGCLATAVMYIASKLYDIGSVSPREFYETIAFGNYGKYSIETDQQRSARTHHPYSGRPSSRNQDYATDREKLFQSESYIRADIEILNPDYIIMPQSIYDSEQAFIDNIKGNAIIIPIYQMNAGVINRTIAPSYPPKRIETLTPTVQEWYTNLHDDGMTDKSKENYLSVFSYLDDVLNLLNERTK